jgi:hypothetical protein
VVPMTRLDLASATAARLHAIHGYSVHRSRTGWTQPGGASNSTPSSSAFSFLVPDLASKASAL